MGHARGKKAGSHDRQKISGGRYQEQSACLDVGEGKIRFNGRKQGSDDDPAEEVEKKDGRQEKDWSDLGAKARACLGWRCGGIVQVKILFFTLRTEVYQMAGKKTNRV
jgi:hypothetical protein